MKTQCRICNRMRKPTRIANGVCDTCFGNLLQMKVEQAGVKFCGKCGGLFVPTTGYPDICTCCAAQVLADSIAESIIGGAS